MVPNLNDEKIQNDIEPANRQSHFRSAINFHPPIPTKIPHRLDIFFFYKFCQNLLNGGIHKDRAPAKQSLLCWPCPRPLPSDRAIPVLWQNL